MAVAPERLPDALAGLPAMGFAGVNVTVPHKQAVMEKLDHCDDTATRLGAVNTIIVHNDGRLTGRNTDAYGFKTSLTNRAGSTVAKQVERNQPVSIIGAGGAARAVVDAILSLGYQNVVITNRTLPKAGALAQHFQQFYPQARIELVSWEKRQEMLDDCGLLVNTSSLGMHGMPALDLDLAALPDDAIVADIVYVPLITPLLAAAKARGLLAIDGLDMLLYQAQAAFTAWHNVTPEVSEDLRQFMLDQIGEGD